MVAVAHNIERRAPTMAASSRRRQSIRDSLTVLLALLGLYWFAVSFFLAKRNLPQISSCHESETLLTDVLGLSQDHVRLLQEHGVLSRSSQRNRSGCWMPRRVESVIILLIDALRFDFCLYNLPESVGSRLPLARAKDSHNQTTRLFRFVADPPTVTVQRLKALTTGGLPTFADLSANFGGATLEQDSWVHQLLRHARGDFAARGRGRPTKAAFVGDDTWLDLFPDLFTEAHPLPSFNTRDLDTVDNGCLRHLPNLTDGVLRGDLELAVVHFLGVDHVGHTYGPHNMHMDAKLRQMDAALAAVLDRIDASASCEAALIFGDHGMTEDGNHGGGTEEEVSAALFVHASPACGALTEAASLERDASLLWGASQTFSSIHQVDMVPTLSMMLGLPVPFGNLGSLVPSLVPGYSYLDTATALALNAAQVWRYLTVYSATANKLPNLHELRSQLNTAVGAFREVIDEFGMAKMVDADKSNQVSGLMKQVLLEALALGQRVWTRFDDIGMITGILILLFAAILFIFPLVQDCDGLSSLDSGHVWEVSLAFIAILFLCGLCTFSNSYIHKEQHANMYFLAIISLAVSLRIQNDPTCATIWRGILLLPVASRINELLVSGHGQDPSLQVHMVHSPLVFCSSVVALVAFRWRLYQTRVTKTFWQAGIDCLALLALLGSWWEKHFPNADRDGFMLCRVALLLLCIGFPSSLYRTIMDQDVKDANKSDLSASVTTLTKVAIAIAVVTGPSAAASLVLYSCQVVAMYLLSQLTGSLRIRSIVIVVLWRLVTRHIFFATNHGCAFNRLQYSSAFIATEEFSFVTGGISLFLNTFGWEMMGLAYLWLLSARSGRSRMGRMYTSLQLLEVLFNCISVSFLRRNMMVWDIFAPHFVFVSIFATLNGLWLVSCTLLSLM